jgi:hypothetical protein
MENKPKGCFVSGSFVPPDILSHGRFVPQDVLYVLSRRTFCPAVCFVPPDVLSCRTFCPAVRFVLPDVLSQRMFCPMDVLSLAVMSQDVLSPDVSSLWMFCLWTFCLGIVIRTWTTLKKIYIKLKMKINKDKGHTRGHGYGHEHEHGHFSLRFTPFCFSSLFRFISLRFALLCLVLLCFLFVSLLNSAVLVQTSKTNPTVLLRSGKNVTLILLSFPFNQKRMVHT